MTPRRVFSGIVLILALTIPCALPAQRTTATLYGTVQDASGGIISGAKVLLRNEATLAEHPTQADERGDFTLTFLPVGIYTLVVENPGFKQYTKTGLKLDAGQQLRYTVTMEVGAITDKVTVTAEAPAIENASPTLSDRYATLQLTELPQSRRDFTQLLALANGYRPSRDGLIFVNGLASGGLSVTVDGVDGSADSETPSPSTFQNFNYIKVVSQEAIQEVHVSKGVISAEVAHTYSANINIITKSGSNELHGSLFESVQNDVLNGRPANLAVTSPKPPTRFNQFGGSVGGPIVKNKLFFFFTYEGYRQSNMQVTNSQVPTTALKARAIAAVPAYKQLLDYLPDPTSPVNADAGIFQGTGSQRASDDHAVARADYQITSGNLLTMRYTRSRPFQSNPRFPSITTRDYRGLTEAGTANFIHSAPSWTSETRFGLNLNETNRVETLWTQGKIPAIEVQGLFQTQGEGLLINGHSYSIEEVIAKTKGRHTLKFGGIYMGRAPGRYNEEVPIFRYGNVNDWLANRPNRVTITFGQPKYRARNWEMGFFIQDDFRFSRKLMLNLGLRYEYFSVLKEKDGRFFNPDGLAGSLARPPRFRDPDSIYDPDYLNFEPRVGFAYNLTPKTVIRSGFGVQVAPPNLRNYSGLVYYSPKVPTRFQFTGSDITSLNLKYPVSNEQMLAVIESRDVPTSYGLVDPSSVNPYNLQWSLDVQRELTPSLAFQTGYVGNKGLKILSSHNYNLPDRVTGIRPVPAVGAIGYKTGSDFSYYHSWQSSLRKRLSRGLMANVNYTWAKAMSIHAGDFWGGNDMRVQDEENWRADKGLTLFDVTHRFVTDWVYELPFERMLKPAGVARHLIGGWQVSGTFTAESGQALNIEQVSNRDFSRPDYVGGDIYAHGDRFQWLNPAAFRPVPVAPSSAGGQPLRPGNVGKNAARAPGAWGTNISLAKNINLSERHRLQLKADAFNAFNHVTLGTPVTDFTRPTFGRILGVGGPRSIQIQARYSF